MKSSFRRYALTLSLFAAIIEGCGGEPPQDALALQESELVLHFPNLEVTLTNTSILPTFGGYQVKATFDIKNIGTGTASGVSLTKTFVTTALLSGDSATTSTNESVGSLSPGATLTRDILCPGTPTSYTICSLAKLRATTTSYEPDLSNNVAYWSSWTCPSAVTIDCQPGSFTPDVCSSEYGWWVSQNCPDVHFIW